MQGPDHHLRPGRPGDAEPMAAIHNRCWRAAYAHHPEATDEMADGMLRRALERFDGWVRPDSPVTVTVAEIDAAVVAYSAVEAHQLVHLFVDPNNARRGLGRTLLTAATDRIADDGHAIAELHVRVGNEPAIALYRAAGWLMTDALLPEEHDGVPYDEHLMVKRLR